MIRLEVKAQRSLFPDGLLLLYTESQSFVYEAEITEEWNRLFGKSRMPADNKFYCEIEVDLGDRGKVPKFIRKLPEGGY